MKMIASVVGLGLALLALGGGHGTSARAREPSAAALDEARRWVSAKLAGETPPDLPRVGLTVYANNDPVQRNARAGKPMSIGKATYRRGLFCHAVSHLTVQLPGPGRRFSAIVGVDSNEQTRPGRGSVRFAVEVDGKETFRSDVMREGTAGVPVSIDLAGARQFTLKVDDAGDDISCDQADWADARVELADGQTVWLGDLPLLDRREVPYSTELPFSFRLGGEPSAELLKGWRQTRKVVKLDEHRSRHELTFTDPKTGLVVRCTAVEYHDFPTVEWTLHVENAGTADSPILSDVRALDARFHAAGSEFVLHHQVGSPCKSWDYRPDQTVLSPESTHVFAPPGGRPTDSVLPYFNLARPGRGLIVAVGWPGQWEASFTRDSGTGLHVLAGQQRTHLILRPGETIRSPLVVLQFYAGDRFDAQNVWRRWMLRHNLPRPGGKLPPVQLAACSSHQFGEMINANEENQKFFIDRYLEERLPLDYWWMDAGWYPNETGWPNTGTWEVDAGRFPRGLRAITDHGHAKGVRSIVWFEPERVTPGTWLYREHPEWLFGADGGQKLFNLGNPEARRWLTEHVDRLIVEQGIDLYRQDFNIDPLSYWRAADAPDRQGMAENLYVAGYLEYWDELRRRHPNMLIDSCASGGRRNDLETLRRAVPLLRSDYIIEPVGNQNHTYGISFWYPYYGTGSGATDPYMLRSVLCPHFTGCWDMRRRDLDFDTVRRVMGQWERFAPCMLGDYYPLTPYSQQNTVWMAWQFDRPDLGQGVVQAFRRADCVYERARLKLRGLDPAATYAVTNLDTETTDKISGRELIDEGLSIPIDGRPGAAVVWYERVD